MFYFSMDELATLNIHCFNESSSAHTGPLFTIIHRSHFTIHVAKEQGMQYI